MISMDGKVVIITGGFGLLGRQLCRDFLGVGAIVAIFDVKEDPALLRDPGGPLKQISFYRTDITSVKSVLASLDAVVRERGCVDVLVNNAYPRNKNWGRAFEEIDLADWCENVDAHLGGYFNITQQVARLMVRQKGGSIINMSSIYGMVGPDFSIYEGTRMTMPAEYAAIKGGLVNFTRYLATYLGCHGIRVNSVSPGGIFDSQDERFVKAYEKKVPLGRMGRPDDVSGVVIFLAGDAARYITGQNIAVDGGWTAW